MYSTVQPQVQRNSRVHACKLQLCVLAITCTCVYIVSEKGAGNFNAGRDEALSRFLWGVVEEMT